MAFSMERFNYSVFKTKKYIDIAIRSNIIFLEQIFYILTTYNKLFIL